MSKKVKGIKIKEQDYEFLKKKKGKKSFPEYISEVVEALELLEHLREAFRVVTKREFSLREIVEELVALGILERRFETGELSVLPISKKSLEILHERMRLGEIYKNGGRYIPNDIKPLEEAIKNFFYIPDNLMEVVRKKAEENKEPIPKVIYDSVGIGINIYGKSFFVLDRETSERLKNFLQKVPPNEGEKLRKDVNRIVKMTVRREIERREKKIKRR